MKFESSITTAGLFNPGNVDTIVLVCYIARIIKTYYLGWLSSVLPSVIIGYFSVYTNVQI